jgi:hypothetical protein
MGKTISDYIIALKEKGLENLACGLHTTKLEDYERLKNSGLPVYADISFKATDFSLDNKKLASFLSKYKEVTIRALPKTPDLPRRYKICAKNYKECMDFLEQEVPENKKEDYKILLTEYQPSNSSGIIILRKDTAIVEIAEAGLDAFSHDEALCHTGIFGISEYHKFRKIKIKSPKKGRIKNKIKNAMYASLNCITKAQLPQAEGYFEFLITQKQEIKFLDYKTSQAYLS